MPQKNPESDYQTVAHLIELLMQTPPKERHLQRLGAHVGLSEIQVQRLFSRWAGISPKRFSQYLEVRDIRARLRGQTSLLDISLDAGLSSTSLVHDHFIRFYAMSPQQVREQGQGINIKHGFYPSPFGTCHIATTPKGICWLAFIGPVSEADSIWQLENEWPRASLQRNDTSHASLVESIFNASALRKPLYLHIKGSNFQLRVWEALLKIPPGECVSYGEIASMVGAPGAARTVGSAIGKNPVSWLIPCHRVICTNGIVGDYRWGTTRKQTILAWERSKREARALGP